MGKYTKDSWKIALFFLFFELFFWIKGIDFIRAIQYMIEFERGFVVISSETGVFHSWIEASVSLVFLLLSILCLQQFIINFIKVLK